MLSEDAQRLNQRGALISAHFCFDVFFFLLMRSRLSWKHVFMLRTSSGGVCRGAFCNVALNCIMVFNQISRRSVYAEAR